MASTVKALVQGFALGQQASGVTRTETLRLFGVIGDAAYGDANIPPIGSFHPTIPLLKVRSVRLEPAPPSDTIVTVEYDTRIGAADKPPAFDPVNFETSFSWAVSYGVSTAEVPIAKTFKFLVPDGLGGNTATRGGWEINSSKTPSARVQTFTARLSVTITFTFPVESSPSLTLAPFISIGEHSGEIHVIQDVPLLFRPKSVIQRTESTADTARQWQVTYEWEYDPGVTLGGVPDGWTDQIVPNAVGTFTSNAVTGDPENGVLLPSLEDPMGLFGTQRFVRTPYGVSQWLSATQPSDPPQFFSFVPYRLNENGWLDLPGMS